MSLTGQPPEGHYAGAGDGPLRCPMPECRRSLESGLLSTTATRTSEPCIHFVAAWTRPAGMVDSVVHALEGNREFVIRNVRVRDAEVQRRVREGDQDELASAIRANLHVVEPAGSGQGGGAAFGDRHEQAAVCRDLAQIIAGPDPMLGGGTMRPA